MSRTTFRITSWGRIAGFAGAAAVTAALLSSGAPAMAAAKGPVTAPAAPAHITGRSAVIPVSPSAMPLKSLNGKCEVGEVCLYYYSSSLGYGSGFDTGHNDPNLFNNHFISAGSGQGSVVGSDAEAVWNRDPNTTVWVCTGLNSTGTCGFVGPNVLGDLSSTFTNQVQSLFWADSTN